MILIIEDGVRTGLINATNNVTYSPVFIGTQIRVMMALR